MDIEDNSYTSFISEHLLKILTALENDETHHPWKLIRNSDSFTLVVNFRAKNRDKRQFTQLKERASGLKSASQHTDKKHKDSSDVRLAEQPKQKNKKTPAQVPRDREWRKAYLRHIKLARQLRKAQLRADNLAAYYAQLQETSMIAIPQAPVVSHPENSGCFDRTSSFSGHHIHLTVDRETVNTAQVQSDLNELSVQEAESEQASILDSDKLELRQYFFNQSPEPDSESDVDSSGVCGNCMKQGEELPRCTGCKFVRYCSKNCQVTDWPSHRQLCQSIQTVSLRDYSRLYIKDLCFKILISVVNCIIHVLANFYSTTICTKCFVQ